MLSHLRTPILNYIYHILWFYLLTDSELSSFAMLAKPYLVSGPNHLPQMICAALSSSAWKIAAA